MASGKFHGLKHMQRRTVLSSAWGAWVGMGTLSLFSAPSRAAAFSQLDATTAVRTALDRGADIAVQQLGQQGGFLNNDKVRIPLPKILEQARPILKMTGKGQQLDDLVVQMNHAAEAAVQPNFPPSQAVLIVELDGPLALDLDTPDDLLLARAVAGLA